MVQYEVYFLCCRSCQGWFQSECRGIQHEEMDESADEFVIFGREKQVPLPWRGDGRCKYQQVLEDLCGLGILGEFHEQEGHIIVETQCQEIDESVAGGTSLVGTDEDVHDELVCVIVQRLGLSEVAAEARPEALEVGRKGEVENDDGSVDFAILESVGREAEVWDHSDGVRMDDRAAAAGFGRRTATRRQHTLAA